MSLIYFLLFGFMISSHPGYSMKIVITYNTYEGYYDGAIPTSINISCTPEVTWNCRQVLAIQVSKNDNSEFALLDSHMEVFYNPILRPNVHVEGVINTCAANSKLTVTLYDVVKQDSGVYKCTSIYLDRRGYLRREVATHSFPLKVSDHDIHDIVRYLVGKLSSMETLVHTLKSQLAEQESDIGKLDHRTTAYRNEVSSKDQTKMIEALTDKFTSLEKTVTDQEKQLQEQSKHSKEQDAKVTTLEKTVTDQEKQLQEQSKHMKEQDAKVSSNVNALMATDRNQSKMIEALTDKVYPDSFSSAFRAGYNYKDKLVVGDTLVFSVPLLDVGNDYNTTTGIFTAPKKGLYVFDLSVRTPYSDYDVHVDLKANGETVASVYAHDSNHKDQSSVSTVVSLQAGDQVRPVVRDFNGYNYLDSSYRYTIFSGFLLKMT